MPKQLLHSLTALLLSAFFLLAGTGYNAVHYCCSTCRAAGIEHVMAESCEAIHHHEHHHHTHTCHHTNGCSLQRLEVSEGAPAEQVQSPAIEVLQLLLACAPTIHAEALILPLYPLIPFCTPPPPSSSGPDILADICRWLC